MREKQSVHGDMCVEGLGVGVWESQWAIFVRRYIGQIG